MSESLTGKGSKTVKVNLPPLKRNEPVPDFASLWSDDKLERWRYSHVLTSLLRDCEEPLVVAVNGEWGTGKTFFLERWKPDYENSVPTDARPGRVIYFSAWQDDDVEDPLLALLGQIHHHLHAKPFASDPNVKRDLETVMENLLRAANRIISIIGKHAGHFIDHNVGVDPVGILRDLANAMAQRVENYSAAIDARVDMRKRLVELSNMLWKESGRPLVIVVDDLDRCNPRFAVTMLERIKHLFNVPHLVFVLGIDMDQFGKTLKSMYGDLDVDNYLSRIIDLEFDLPTPSRADYIAYLMESYQLEKYVVDREGEAGAQRRAVDEFKETFLYLANHFGMTLRQMERCIRELIAVERSVEIQNAKEATLLAVLCALRCHRKELYHGMVHATIGPKPVIDALFPEDFLENKSRVPASFTHISEVVYAAYKGSRLQRCLTSVHSHATATVFEPTKSIPDSWRGQKMAAQFDAAIADCSIDHEVLTRLVGLLQCFSEK